VKLLDRLAALIPNVDCCPHPDPKAPTYSTHSEVTAAVEEIDAGHVSTARQILVTLLDALTRPSCCPHPDLTPEEATDA
jgi:hypothetical protein